MNNQQLLHLTHQNASLHKQIQHQEQLKQFNFGAQQQALKEQLLQLQLLRQAQTERQSLPFIAPQHALPASTATTTSPLSPPPPSKTSASLETAHFVFVVPYLVTTSRFLESYPPLLARIGSPIVSEKSFRSTLVRLNYQVVSNIRPFATMSTDRVLQASYMGLALSLMFGGTAVYTTGASIANANLVDWLFIGTAMVSFALFVVLLIAGLFLKHRRDSAQSSILALLDEVNGSATAATLTRRKFMRRKSGARDPAPSKPFSRPGPNDYFSPPSLQDSRLYPAASADRSSSGHDSTSSTTPLHSVSAPPHSYQPSSPSSPTSSPLVPLQTIAPVQVKWTLKGDIGKAACVVDRKVDKPFTNTASDLEAGTWHNRRLFYRVTAPSTWITTTNTSGNGSQSRPTSAAAEFDADEAFLEIHVWMQLDAAERLLPELFE
ncbi:hypothetical protein BC831DRAFT_467463 [Entophlyctis helioformis]|nr:hypothetical protein BC831DRAFT_467463 [Entophlyctis helioformis]